MTRLLLVAAVALVAVLATGVVSGAGAEWDVYPGAGTPIQDAIDGAGEGDTIHVHAGMYVGNVDVWKQVTLEGEGADVATVQAADGGDHVFELIASWVNISGFAIKGATRNAGIYLNGADHCNIYENNCSNNNDGIYLHSSSNHNTLTENDCSDSHHSIYLHSSSNHNTLNENNCSNNSYGVILYSSSNYNQQF